MVMASSRLVIVAMRRGSVGIRLARGFNTGGHQVVPPKIVLFAAYHAMSLEDSSAARGGRSNTAAVVRKWSLAVLASASGPWRATSARAAWTTAAEAPKGSGTPQALDV